MSNIEKWVYVIAAFLVVVSCLVAGFILGLLTKPAEIKYINAPEHHYTTEIKTE